jgi:LPS O-antigen subunit length determinant protein (WzzB/FepE family)
LSVDVATATTPLFFIGSDALDAELENLKLRTNDDAFIPGLRDLQEQIHMLSSIKVDDPFIIGLRDLQEQLALLRSIKIEKEKLSSVNIDQAAYPSKSPFKPDRKLIIWLGTIVGLFLGIFLVFFVSFIQKQKETHSQ